MNIVFLVRVINHIVMVDCSSMKYSTKRILQNETTHYTNPHSKTPTKAGACVSLLEANFMITFLLFLLTTTAWL
jgi:hypothetical protein